MHGPWGITSITYCNPKYCIFTVRVTLTNILLPQMCKDFSLILYHYVYAFIEVICITFYHMQYLNIQTYIIYYRTDSVSNKSTVFFFCSPRDYIIEVETCRGVKLILWMYSELLFMVLLLFVLCMTGIHYPLYSLKQ